MIPKVRDLIEEAWRNTNNWESNYHEAQGLLEAALLDDPNSIVLLTCLGAVYSDQGFHRKADGVLRKAISLGSMDGNTFFSRAVALLNLGKRGNAERLFKKANGLSGGSETWAAYFDAQGH